MACPAGTTTGGGCRSRIADINWDNFYHLLMSERIKIIIFILAAMAMVSLIVYSAIKEQNNE